MAKESIDKLTIHIPAGLHDQIADYCERYGLSKSALIRLACHQFLDRNATMIGTSVPDGSGTPIENAMTLLSSENASPAAKMDAVLRLGFELWNSTRKK